MRALANQHSPKPDRRKKRQRLPLGVVLLTLGWVCLSAPATLARVNPLMVIERQLHKANMLIVLDTSGSMTGVPGGQFSNSSEVGVDCDNGDNCRNGGLLGMCKKWGRTCMSDDDCRHGYCSKDGVSICAADIDCLQDTGTCSATPSVTCTNDSQCTPQTGTCSVTGGTCQNNSDCGSAGRCKYTTVVCTNVGGSCPNVQVCAATPSKTCTTAADCPHLGITGTCKLGSTPKWGCANDGECPSMMTCSEDTHTTCRTDADCPSSGTGSAK